MRRVCVALSFVLDCGRRRHVLRVRSEEDHPCSVVRTCSSLRARARRECRKSQAQATSTRSLRSLYIWTAEFHEKNERECVCCVVVLKEGGALLCLQVDQCNVHVIHVCMYAQNTPQVLADFQRQEVLPSLHEAIDKGRPPLPLDLRGRHGDADGGAPCLYLYVMRMGG